MVVAAFRGALGFLTRLPVGHDERAWDAFRRTPLAFPLAGYGIGALVALPLVLPVPDPTVALAFVAWLYVVTGINHVDGLADLGDALVVHGDRERRREVMRDTTVGVGAVVLTALVVAGLALAGLALAGFSGQEGPLRAVIVVVAAEVGAKLGTATLVCLGTATHEGLASGFTRESRPRSLLLPALAATPVALLSWPHPATGLVLVAALTTTLVVFAWSRRALGGVSGDVLGAANELARVVALHAGVIAWTRW